MVSSDVDVASVGVVSPGPDEPGATVVAVALIAATSSGVMT
jgi:hypothetical protein